MFEAWHSTRWWHWCLPDDCTTPNFKKQQNRYETSWRNGTKFTGIFAFLVINL